MRPALRSPAAHLTVVLHLVSCAPMTPDATREGACWPGAAGCGTCAPPCAPGTRCEAGRCECPSGRALCDDSCVDLRNDPHHCGACGRPCRGGERCEEGTCGPTCSSNERRCGGECVSPYVDPRHCGACGRACERNETCRSGACVCEAAHLWCAGAGCVDPTRDGRHCGGCHNACPAATMCVQARCMGPCVDRSCAPTVDRCAGATTAVWQAVPGTSPEVAAVATVTLDTRSAPRDPSPVEGCGAWAGPVVRIRLELDAPAFVYADTLGATWDTRLAFVGADCRSTPATTSGSPCGDDACGGAQSQVVALLHAGVWHLALGGRGEATGSATVRLQRLRAPSGASVRVASSTARYGGSTAGHTGAVSSPCGGVGPEDLYWWTTCDTSSQGILEASTCDGADWSNVLWYVGPRARTCALGSGACGVRARIQHTTTPGAGLHGLYVDGFNDGRGAVAGPYTLALTRP